MITQLKFSLLFRKIMMMLLIAKFSLAFSQLTTSKMEIWTKASNSNKKDAAKCTNPQLLNFNCGIKDNLMSKAINYQKDKGYSLIVVHTSKDDELIWEDESNKVNLSNNNFKKQNKIKI